MLLLVLCGAGRRRALSRGAYRGNRKGAQAQRCQAVDVQLDPVFGAAAKPPRVEGLPRPNVPMPTMWQRVENNLSHYLFSWRAMRRDTCRATFVASTQAPNCMRGGCAVWTGDCKMAAFMNLLRTADEQVLDSAVDPSSDLRCLNRYCRSHFLQQLVGEKPLERDRLDGVGVVSSPGSAFCTTRAGAGGERPLREVLSAAQQIDNLPLQTFPGELSMLNVGR